VTAATCFHALRWAHEHQTVAAYGRPNSAREAGKLAVERHADALRRLADA
jgi:hypothetical protein